jgi:hypothetical protein
VHLTSQGQERSHGEERVPESLVYSRFFDIQAADRSTNGVEGLLAPMEDKRIEVRLHATAKAQAAQTFKQPAPGRGVGGNPDRLTPLPDKSVTNKEQEEKEKEKRDNRKKDMTRQHKMLDREA